MTELEALRRVAEAARKWNDAYNHKGKGPEYDYKEDATDERLDLSFAVDALDALPTPAAPATPARSRLEALEALRAMVRDYDRGTGQNVRWADIMATLDELDALPAPATEPEREVVAPLRAVSVAITQADSSGSWTRHVVMSDGSLWDQIGGQWVPVPLPRVPEVVGEVG